MGRTHLQDAVSIRLGQEFTSYSQVLSRDIKRIDRLYRKLLDVNLGATAVKIGLNADPNYTEKVINILLNETGLELKVQKISLMLLKIPIYIQKYPPSLKYVY